MLTEASETPDEMTNNAIIFGQAYIMQGVIAITKYAGLNGDKTFPLYEKLMEDMKSLAKEIVDTTSKELLVAYEKGKTPQGSAESNGNKIYLPGQDDPRTGD